MQDEVQTCNAKLAEARREKEDLGSRLQEKTLQLTDLQREAADKKRALDSECEKLSREKHKRQRIEEDNKVFVHFCVIGFDSTSNCGCAGQPINSTVQYI